MAKKYRTEWKYRCDEWQLSSLEERLKVMMNLDSHTPSEGYYTIHSLYFDDIKDSFAQENDAGIAKRHKYRIRYYGSRPEMLRLERKEKYNGRCHKASAPVSIEEYADILNGNFSEVFWNTDSDLMRRFCAESMAKGITPKAIVRYQRTAYTDEILNIRITFDRRISVSDEVDQFLTGGYHSIPVQDFDEHVLEVKFDDILPSHLKHVLTLNDLTQTTFSKYYNGRIKMKMIRGGVK